MIGNGECTLIKTLVQNLDPTDCLVLCWGRGSPLNPECFGELLWEGGNELGSSVTYNGDYNGES